MDDGRMDGWMDGWMNGRTKGRTEDWLEGWMVGGNEVDYIMKSSNFCTLRVILLGSLEPNRVVERHCCILVFVKRSVRITAEKAANVAEVFDVFLSHSKKIPG
jgi:hypothetical protein